MEIEQTLLEYEWENEIFKREDREKKKKEEKT